MKGFKDIRGYEGLYKISNYGKIINRHGKELKSYSNKYQYRIIMLCKNGKAKTYFLHKLVALHFVYNKDYSPCIHHKNHLKYDNRAENLEWVTHYENNNYYLEFKKAQ